MDMIFYFDITGGVSGISPVFGNTSLLLFTKSISKVHKNLQLEITIRLK